MEKCALSIFCCVLCNKNDYKKPKFFQLIKSFCQNKQTNKKNQGELWTNKQPSLRWRFPCSIWNRNKLRHSNSVAFDAKKVKETLTARLSKTQLLKKNIFAKPLKPKGFESSPKCLPSCPSLLYLVVSSLHTQADFFFFHKKELLLGVQWLLVELKWGRMDGCKLLHLKEIFRLIYWKEILCYSCEFVPQIISSSIIVEPK